MIPNLNSQICINFAILYEDGENSVMQDCESLLTITDGSIAYIIEKVQIVFSNNFSSAITSKISAKRAYTAIVVYI